MFYWAATLLAGLIGAAVFVVYLFSETGTAHVFPIVPLVLAGAIWLLGWAAREVLARR